MPTLARTRSALVLIDFQARLMPAIHDAEGVVANAGRLLAAAEALGVPTLQTEQNPKGLGPTLPELVPAAGTALAKMTFDACRTGGLVERLPAGAEVVVAGCEAHVCVLQTVLGLLDRDVSVYVVADAVGSRRPESKEAALRRMERQGADIVTTEMVIFEWLETAEDPQFKSVIALIK
ncbi:MAG TPA: isochorismatase family protein [Acidimicrobiia bacterium]|nr:isochorismatase family protein [Acidimicrobiia bacterium]